MSPCWAVRRQVGRRSYRRLSLGAGGGAGGTGSTAAFLNGPAIRAGAMGTGGAIDRPPTTTRDPTGGRVFIRFSGFRLLRR